jgi:hypothetical protein
MGEQVVELGPNLQDPSGSVLFVDLIRNLSNEGFPIRRGDGSILGDFLAI